MENGADLEMASKGGTNPMMLAAAIFDVPGAAGGTEATARLLVRLGAKLEPPKAIELELSNGIPTLPDNNFLPWQDRARGPVPTASATAATRLRPTAREPRALRSASGSSTSLRPQRASCRRRRRSPQCLGHVNASAEPSRPDQ